MFVRIRDDLVERCGHDANTYFRHQSLAYVEKARVLVGDD